MSHAESPFWIGPADELLRRMETDAAAGLSAAEATRRLRLHGENRLRDRDTQAAWLQFLLKFRNPLVIVLLVASGAAAATGDTTSFVIIAVIVVMSVTLDFVQEYRAGRAAERLRHSVSVRTRVLRDGSAADIAQADLVPGDIVLLAAGDLVPCDGRVLEARDFFVNQALLTGEAYPIEKTSAEASATEELLAAPNAVMLGTSVVSGSARVMACRTGQGTALGGIAASLASRAPESDFERGIRRFGLLIMRMTVLMTLFVLLVNALFHRPWLESFLFSLALAVGLTPELLPMVVSVTLARGAMRLAAAKVIVKRLAAIHNLGSMDVLCTDKTGTLTEARMRLQDCQDADGRESGRVLELACLNSRFETGLKSPLDEAILERATMDLSAWRKVDEVPFDFERRRVSVLLDNGAERVLVVKGAPEDLLRLSAWHGGDEGAAPQALDEARRAAITARFEAFGEQGLRVLGVAFRRVERSRSHAVVADEGELVFAGFVTFLDRPKEDAGPALAALARDGVAVKVITGDNERVAQQVCARLGFEVTGMLTGAQIQGLDDLALSARVERVNLFCRVSPAQKNRLILALKRRGHVVGYLGDGINDAPSLHSADVGISVEGAVDVAKAAADMILLERDLRVLHSGVLEGRRTFGNIMKYIMMGTSSNFGNMFSMAGGSLFLPFLPMLPVQILLNNLLYDISELPIPLDRVDEEDLARPRRWDMDFIRSFMLVIGTVSSAFDFLTFHLLLKLFDAGEALFHTGWFVESLASQALVIFVIRTRLSPLRSRPHAGLAAGAVAAIAIAMLLPFTGVGRYLGFVPLPPAYFAMLALLLGTYLLAVEGIKRVFYRRFAAGLGTPTAAGSGGLQQGVRSRSGGLEGGGRAGSGHPGQ